MDGELVATVAGAVERVNKLVSVQTVRTRYSGEIGDTVVGRITEVSPCAGGCARIPCAVVCCSEALLLLLLLLLLLTPRPPPLPLPHKA